MRIAASLIGLAVLLIPQTRASTMSFTGNLSDGNQVFVRTFSLENVEPVTIQTWSYSGGTNAAGKIIPSGGFDPVVAVFVGTGSAAELLDYNDDGNCPPGHGSAALGTCFDSSLSYRGLLPGTYTLALTASSNYPNGPTFGDGFSGGGSFVDLYGNQRSSFYAVDVTIGSTSSAPEPTTSFIVGLAIFTTLIVRGIRQRGNKSS